MTPTFHLSRIVPALGLVLASACGGEPTSSDAASLLRVVDIHMTTLNTYYPERPPRTPLNRPVCQVELDVTCILPDPCAGFGQFTNLGFDGRTFRFEVQAVAGFCGGGPVTDSFGLCLPGIGADPPPPALPPGHYDVIVNGFRGGFDIP